MNLERIFRRAWGWLRPVRSLLHSWNHEIRAPLGPHGVVLEVRRTQAGVPVLVAMITTDPPPVLPALPGDDWSLGLLAAARQEQFRDVLSATVELAGHMSRQATTDVVVLTESTQLGTPAVLAAGHLAREDERR